ncbi:MAG TPA: hypothetical protein VLT87_00810 [Thermoanaerobaculia bacterium]|nr:hypothetical protein [Thermoanaerobaculia bacterium]
MSGARVYRFRSEESPSVPPDPEICAAAPFEPTARLGAVLWEDAGDGPPRRLGTATACLRVTDPAFPPGSRVPFFAVFHLPEGPVTASGDGTIVSNDVPVPGLVLAVCHLRVVDAPKGFSGGAAASLSVFNPAGLAGFATGSHWTVQLFGAD